MEGKKGTHIIQIIPIVLIQMSYPCVEEPCLIFDVPHVLIDEFLLERVDLLLIRTKVDRGAPFGLRRSRELGVRGRDFRVVVVEEWPFEEEPEGRHLRDEDGPWAEELEVI
jgi:hypothetical protein